MDDITGTTETVPKHISRQTKQIGIVELTVPNEDRIEVSGELKRLKYEHIAKEGLLNGRSTIKNWEEKDKQVRSSSMLLSGLRPVGS